MIGEFIRGGFLRGRRTYIIGGLMVLGSAAQWLIGDASLSQVLPNFFEGLGLMALRAGVNQAANPDANREPGAWWRLPTAKPDPHRERLRELVAELIAKAQADNPNLPPIDADRVLAAIESRDEA
jgi:hypothetical protein